MRLLQGPAQQKLVLGLSVMMLASLGHKAEAQYSLASESIVGVNNGLYISSLDFKYVSDNSVATATATKSFTGMDGLGNTQTMTFTGNTVSQSDYGRLHVLTTGSLTNSYYNANNSDSTDQNGNVIDPNGSPTHESALGFAIFNDTLQYGGTLQSGYKARYIFHVDGTNSGTGAAAAGLDVTIGSDTVDQFFDFDNGFLSTDWVTADHAINGITPQTINVQFSDSALFNNQDLTDGQDYTSMSDFSSTLVLSGIELIDANGNLASGWTVTSASGTTYNTIQGVPEPGAVALLLGLALPGSVLLLRRRNHSAS